MVEVGVFVCPIGWVLPIFTVACGSGFAPPCCKGVVAFPTGPAPGEPGAFARGIVLAPIGDALASGAVLTWVVGPRGSALLRGIVLAPGAVCTGLVGPAGAGGGVAVPAGGGVAVGAGGGVGALPLGGGVDGAEGAGGGPPVGAGAIAVGEGGAAVVVGAVGPVVAAETCADAIGAVEASPGIGAVEAS